MDIPDPGIELGSPALQVDPCALLASMQNDTTAMENSIEIPQIKIELKYDPAISHLSTHTKEF